MSTKLSTSRQSPGELPEGWIDRLFVRLAGLYGKHWLDLWADIPMREVKNAWSEALVGIDGEQMRLALAHLSQHNKFPPTAPEFAALCRDFRVTKVARLAIADKRREPMPQHVLDAFDKIRGGG